MSISSRNRSYIGVFDATFDDLQIPAGDRPALGRDYLDAVARLGIVS